MPWVQLTRVKNIRVGGVSTTYHAGDSVEVGKQTAIGWLLDGSAKDPYGDIGPPVAQALGRRSEEFGILILCDPTEVSISGLGRFGKDIQISYASDGAPSVPFKYTLIWDSLQIVSERMINAGFLRILDKEGIMEAWEIAACLLSHDTLASQVGDLEDQQKTEELIGDLRLPVYQTSVLWVRKTPVSEKVIADWLEGLKELADSSHAFLRSVYINKPLLCTLPPDWTSWVI